MSERTPHEEMVYWLHADATWIALPYPKEAERIHKAADRLADLDAKVTCTGAGDCKALAHIHGCYADHPCRHNDDWPPCPTCGGVGQLQLPNGPATVSTELHYFPCPDCVDGKVSIEQLVATYNAVWDDIDSRRVDSLRSSHDLRRHLRSVKPNG